jgi:hypothetical protein
VPSTTNVLERRHLEVEEAREGLDAKIGVDYGKALVEARLAKRSYSVGQLFFTDSLG